MQIVTVKCLPNGLIDMTHLRELCGKHEKNLSAIMVTYPSTYGIFDNNIKEITQLIHEKGGQVYIDGANLNAMVGHTGPGFFGGDVCHINPHKTFSIPHGGGGPGMGPIGEREHLAPFLPNSSRGGAQVGGSKAFGQVSQAAYGSASILNISYLEMGMLGSEGLTKATSAAIVSANYLASKLCGAYDILYRDPNGRVAHEFILDLRKFKKTCEIEAEDVAKRLMDYGFHAPTLSFPVPGTLMVEPTESEPIAELDRFVEAMLSIRAEIADIESGKQPRQDNVLKNAPHTHEVVVADSWSRPYTREVAAYPVPTLRANKFWPTVGRIEGAYGDTHLFCSCS
jgi:glycine dehydrogenase